MRERLRSSRRYTELNMIPPVRRTMLALLAALTILSLAQAQEPATEKKVVTLTIDYADGVQKTFKSLDWKEKQTVFDALQLAAKHPRGITFKHRGSGETVLVTAIDDVTNKAGGNSWLYEVNGKLADRSCGVYELKPGDAVLWKFGSYK
jgi:hypothetical protein